MGGRYRRLCPAVAEVLEVMPPGRDARSGANSDRASQDSPGCPRGQGLPRGKAENNPNGIGKQTEHSCDQGSSDPASSSKDGHASFSLSRRELVKRAGAAFARGTLEW